LLLNKFAEIVIDITAAYVCINNNLRKVGSILQAIDFLF